jgi:hypothetical protein
MRGLHSISVALLLAFCMAEAAGAQVGEQLYGSHDMAGSSTEAEPSDPLGERNFYAKGLFDGSFASDEQTQQAVGPIKIGVKCPQRRIDGDLNARGVKITVAKGGSALSDHSIINTLAGAGLTRVFAQCPMGFQSIIAIAEFKVGFLAIYGPPSEGARPTLLYSARKYEPLTGWESVTDVLAERLREEQLAAQARASQKAAEAQQQMAEQQQQAAQALAKQQQQAQSQAQAEQEARTQQAIASIKDFIKRWAPWLLMAMLALFGFAKRETLSRWYFFHFHRHPAERMVERALLSPSTSPANARALAQALGELPTGSSALRAARLRQAENLYHRLEVASAGRLHEMEQRLNEAADEAKKEAAFYGMQEAVALAAVALERAKAAHQTASKLSGGYFR